MTHKPKRKPELLSCGGVIFRRGSNKIEYLIVQHASRSRHWSFPKGAVEAGETEEEAALREMEEESGLSRNKLKVLAKLEREALYFLQRRRRSPQQPKRVKFFLTESSGGLVRICSELIDHKWLNFREANLRLTHKQDREILREANDTLQRIDKEKSGHFNDS
ncbi:MAG: NUDIX domain-containing protein [Candidatus Heimdallarchaeota archaeon]